MDTQRRRHGPEGLKAYELALKFAAQVDEIARSARYRTTAVRHLVEAAESVVFNLAEGCGHFTRGKRLTHFQIASGSAAECKAALTRVAAGNPRLSIREARRTLDMLCILILSLIESVEHGPEHL